MQKFPVVVLLLVFLVIGIFVGRILQPPTVVPCPSVQRFIGISGTQVPFRIVPDPVYVFRQDTLSWSHPTAGLEIRLDPRLAADTLVTAAPGQLARTTVLPDAPIGTRFKYRFAVILGEDERIEQDPEIIVRPK